MKSIKAIYFLSLGATILVVLFSSVRAVITIPDISLVGVWKISLVDGAVPFFAILVSFYLYQIAKWLFWYYKGYRPSCIKLWPLFIQVNPVFKIRFSFHNMAMNFTDYLPYDAVIRVQNKDDLLVLREDYRTSEIISFFLQLCFLFSVIVVYTLIGEYVIAIAMLIVIFAFFQLGRVDDVVYQGFFVKTKQMHPHEMIYYLANQAILMEGDRTFVYAYFQKYITENEIRASFHYIMRQTLKHIYMESCREKSIQVREDVYSYLLANVFSEEDFEMRKVQNIERFELAKVIICKGIIADNEILRMDMIAWLHAVCDFWDNFPIKLKNLVVLHEWYIFLAREQKILKTKQRWFKNEVIRRNITLNKLDRYCEIEDFIIEKVRSTCLVVD